MWLKDMLRAVVNVEDRDEDGCTLGQTSGGERTTWGD